MTTALQTKDHSEMQTGTPGAVLGSEGFFSLAQEQMILKTFLGGATKEEAVVLLETVRRRRLDPFSRQVYFVKRYDMQKREEVWAIQTSIDGLRSIAERTGKYDGQSEPVYGEDEAGKFCKVTVYRKDWSPGRGATGVAYLSEFIQKKKDGTVTRFWVQMPRLMLAKCAEALAIRKAFPEDTGGLYIGEEMREEKEEHAPRQPPAVEAEKHPPSLPPSMPPVEAEPQGVEVETIRQPNPGAYAALWERVRAKWPKLAATKMAWAVKTVGLPSDLPTDAWTPEQAHEVERLIFPDVNP